LGVPGKYSSARNSRSFARAAVLLCVVAHAGLVNITHHHGGAERFPRAAAGGQTSLGSGLSGPLETSRNWCLSCRLQSNFVSDIRQISITPDLCLVSVSPDLFISEPTSCGVSLILSDRAPPVG
jgi:hypothetical protein